MGNRAAERELVRFGCELESLGAAQVGTSFTGDLVADQLLENDPNAFLLGVLFTQGIPAERAWAAPQRLKERLGTLDLGFLESNPEAVRAAVQAAPMLHRFKETLPQWIVAAASIVRSRYGGDASAIWPRGAHVLDVTERLSEFDGIGRKKAVMAVEILTRHFDAGLVGRERGTVAYDVHVRRVFLRSGIAHEDSVEAVEAAALAACPEAPGTLDLAAWLVGRDWCRPKAPRCDLCRLGRVCDRRVELNPEGVGVRRAHSADRKTRPESSLG
jgi:uncharacterized HhH-GPD family protein